MSRQTRRALDRLYDRLPSFECQQRCAESCGPIAMSRAEWQRIVDAIGTPEGAEVIWDGETRMMLIGHEDAACPMLRDGSCTVYAIRPLICRLWGLAEGMECPFGCKPTRYITREEGFALLTAAARIGA